MVVQGSYTNTRVNRTDSIKHLLCLFGSARACTGGGGLVCRVEWYCCIALCCTVLRSRYMCCTVTTTTGNNNRNINNMRYRLSPGRTHTSRNILCPENYQFVCTIERFYVRVYVLATDSWTRIEKFKFYRSFIPIYNGIYWYIQMYTYSNQTLSRAFIDSSTLN